ncbi:MAG TPA: HNH endonuclease [Vicinamibacterales bacterium]|nr:HNH endonuclease [Vicinamibacterales bacterium]
MALVKAPGPGGAPFSEAVKRDARRLAGFKCCYCRDRMGDEVHHLTPQEEGGSGDLDNAILLCAQCHTDYGHRKDKRAQLRQARDVWYEIVKERWPANTLAEVIGLEDLATKQDLAGIERRLTDVFGSFVAGLSTGAVSSSQAINVASTMINSISPSPSFTAIGLPPACHSCGSIRPLGAIFCPQCGVRFQ